MGFYCIWVRSLGYRGKEPLTYSSDVPLAGGAIVRVPLQKEFVLGFVEKEVNRPKFACKPIEKVYDLPLLPPQTILLAKWLLAFYATNLGTATNQFLPADLSEKTIQKLEPVVSKALAAKLPLLNPTQQAVVKKITKADTYVLHGKTGSGKTRVYLELAIETLASGKSAIVLTPEISLTSQLSQSFRDVFGDQVIVLHSQLTPVQRQKVWLQILGNGERRMKNEEGAAKTINDQRKTKNVPLVIVGPRSALFCPVANLGLIVIDEAHESSYKQEQAPYYHATRVAAQLAHEHQATLIIGSATPSVGDYYLAQQRSKQILRMDTLAQEANAEATSFQVVDLRDRSLFGRSSHLSNPLLDAVRVALGKHEQVLIYLNRRGTARIVLCENCGWQALCPHCDLPLVYHADSGRFRCHTCGFSQTIVTSCPTCGHPSVTFKSFGTKAITEEIQKLFPEAKVQRFDTDNTKAERFEQHYEAVKAGDVDILVGTQLLAKGLDLPNLSTIGIVLAESSLYLPDFSSQERTYQLLSQALGRVGRGHRKGYAIIQTYQPDSPVLQSAISGEWDNFYQNELAERQKFHFPPFYHLLKISCKRATYKSAETAAQKLKTEITSKIKGIDIDGPAPSFYEKSQGKYQCQLVLRSTHRQKLLEAIALLPPSGWTYDIDPVNLL